MEPIDKLLRGYFQACAAIGKPLNGLQKLKMRLELKNADANRVLEIIDEIEKMKVEAHTHSITIDVNLHSHAGWNGTGHNSNNPVYNSNNPVYNHSHYDVNWDNGSGGTK